MKRWVAVALATLLPACDATNPMPALGARLAAAAVWSGGEVTVIASALAPPAPLPTARLDNQPLALRRINDSSVAARLPDGNGPRVLRLDAAGHEPFTTTIELYGFDRAEAGPMLSGFLQSLPGGPLVLGAGDSGLVEVDVRANRVLRAWGDTLHSPDCTWGVGASVREGHYVLVGKDANGACGDAAVWRYGAQLARVDSFPAREDEWTIAEIGPGGLIAGSDDQLWIARCDGGACTPVSYAPLAGSLTGVTLGRLAGRAVLHSSFGWLVDATTGDTVARGQPGPGPGYHVEGAAFSAAEDTAWVAGVNGNTGRILAIDPASGAGRDTLPLGARPFDIVRHPARPWLVVVALRGALAAAEPELLILDQRTLDTVAVLRAPGSEALPLSTWHQFRLVPDLAMHAVYVVATVQAYDVRGRNARILRFRLVPGT